jgi:hypothetical protein
VRYSCSHLAVASRGPPKTPNAQILKHPTPNIEHPTPKIGGRTPNAQILKHPTPNIEHPTPKIGGRTPNAQILKHPTPNIEHPTPKKNFFRFAVPSLIWGFRTSSAPLEVFRGWSAARGSRPLPFRGGGGGEVGGRCTSRGGAKQAARGGPNALLSAGPGGDPAAHPTPSPNAQQLVRATQRPNTQRSAIASPTVHLRQPRLHHRGLLDQGFRTWY